ncbi:hypothetical protein J6590_052470, partial [Homalodisca vitripennis]
HGPGEALVKARLRTHRVMEAEAVLVSMYQSGWVLNLPCLTRWLQNLRFDFRDELYLNKLFVLSLAVVVPSWVPMPFVTSITVAVP